MIDRLQDAPLWLAPNWEDKPELSVQCAIDQRPIRLYAKDVISGYLNLGVSDGWEEGHDSRVGQAFSRFILSRYFFEKMEDLGENRIVLEKTVRAFRKSSPTMIHLFAMQAQEDHKPLESRIAFDEDVNGWQRHAVSRLSGNLGSQYIPSKPFFEILINSQRNSPEDPLCQPFFISIHTNEEELEKRRKMLASCKMLPGQLAHLAFYDKNLMTPDHFLSQYPEKLGPKSARLLKGLSFLQKTTIPAQKVGNCWIKQPMRCLLASLFIELLTHREELSIEDAWEEAKKLYIDIQKSVAIPLVEELLKLIQTTDIMKGSALLAIEKQKSL